ncbi:MAG: AAA family ATPase [Ignavibacteria bacterium]|jgi:replicative DNA helicase|nr:AAA family ATPase [Ignavibacteria bacterium]MCU7505268.1 AAA family ATPase [Ignavibacteria bacterium]MCU7522329.1 AAA family ATPase [Ignavibacteria bacterium]
MKDEICLRLEAEVLNTILTDKHSFISAAAINAPSGIFSGEEHRIIYSQAMDYFFETGLAPTFDKLYDRLFIQGSHHELRDYFLNVIQQASINRHTGNIIKRLTEIKIEREIRNCFKNTHESGLDFANKLIEDFNLILQENIGGCIKEIRNIDVAEEVLKELHDGLKGVNAQYIPTLIPNLDRQITGIPKNQVTIIAARPGMGKTDLMLQLMRNFMRQGLKPGIFSLEMDAKSLLIRNLSEAANINTLTIDGRELNQEEINMLIQAAKKYSLDDYIVDDTPRQNPESIKAKINYWRLRHKVDVIIIDYLTLIQTRYQKQRYDLEIGELVKDLRSLAKQTGVPIVILSQLNRDSEKRISHRPQLGDLRESGSIEQEAHLVLLLYRPAEYGVNPFEGSNYLYYDNQGSPLKAEEYMEIVIAKARSGRTGVVPVQYVPSIHHIEGARCVKV